MQHGGEFNGLKEFGNMNRAKPADAIVWPDLPSSVFHPPDWHPPADWRFILTLATRSVTHRRP
jgi:hypothetical protein